MRRAQKTRAQTTRARIAVPAALIGTLAASLSALPADATPRELDRPGRLAERFTPLGIEHLGRLAARAVPTAVAPATYVVVRGDTVSGIAARFGLRTNDVLGWNGLAWSSVIHPGQVLVLVPAAPPSPAPAPTPAPAANYTVAAGDTLSGIASRHGVTLAALFQANGLGYGSIIYPGQAVSIPGATPVAAAPAPAPAPAPPPAPAPAPSASHTVSAGDTLSGIASRYGVTLAALFQANGLGFGSIIYPGQTVTVPGAQAAAVQPAPAPVAASATGLDAEQAANAALIIQVGRELGVSDRGIAIALATAMVESWIRNLDWGDRDSLGLFQQRPSTGWGTPAEVRDAARSIRVFYGGPADPNGNRTRGLLDIAGWEGMGFAQAAQAVQRSAFPDRYAKWESAAYGWIAALG